MSAQTDFHLTLDRASGLVLDATCSARAAASRPLPHPHHRHLTEAIRDLDRAQQHLFKARNDPWSQPQPVKPRQLSMLW